MKMRKYIYAILAVTLILFTAQSCFQDLEQDPAFNYPEEPPKPPVSEDGQIFYMAFEDNYEDAVSEVVATKVGNPTFTEGKVGKAYAGATDSYLTFRLLDLISTLGSDLTIGFWYNVNPVPDRAGIITISPDGIRTSGIRIFRENEGGKQRIKANIGNGTAEGWLDGGTKADLDPATAGWKYITLTLAKGAANLYIDGEVVATNALTEISWNGCDVISVGSGAPRFVEWNHLSDNSLIDELRIYNKALTATEIIDIINSSSAE